MWQCTLTLWHHSHCLGLRVHDGYLPWWLQLPSMTSSALEAVTLHCCTMVAWSSNLSTLCSLTIDQRSRTALRLKHVRRECWTQQTHSTCHCLITHKCSIHFDYTLLHIHVFYTRDNGVMHRTLQAGEKPYSMCTNHPCMRTTAQLYIHVVRGWNSTSQIENE